MIIKKFTGKSEKEALETAKKELGEGVVVMNVKKVKKKGFLAFLSPQLIEVTVALEDESEKYSAAVTAINNVLASSQSREPAPATKAQAAPPAASSAVSANTGTSAAASSAVPKAAQSAASPAPAQPAPVQPAGASASAQTAKTPPAPAARASVPEPKAAPVMEKRESSAIEEKLDSLQYLLEQQLQRPEEDDKGTKKAEPKEETETDKFMKLLHRTMLDNEVDEKYADQIIEEIELINKPNIPFDYALANIYQKMILKFGKPAGITPAESGLKVVFFIGPTGVGKTTTIAKIASKFSVDEKKKVALLTADTYRIAAVEQLRVYANILEVPFRVIYSEEEFKKALEDFKGYDYIFIDTAGHSHQNSTQKDNISKLIHSLDEKVEKEVYLVLSATTKYRDLISIADSYKSITDYKLIFTKLDETTTLGNLLNMKLYTGSSLSYVTCGQNVPDDIEDFNPQKTVKRLLGGKN